MSDGHRPRKRFGQHFLTDQNIIDRIIVAIAPQPDDILIEIGPGSGALTRSLVDSPARLVVIEKDRDLARSLVGEYPGDKLQIHCADALQFDYCAIANDPVRVVGNLPYNISTPLIFHLLASLGCIRDMVFMLQTEVVDRMEAAPGNKTYGRLSVMVQSRCVVEKLFTVDRSAFTPPPKVESAIVRLVPLEKPLHGIRDLDTFQRIVQQAFNQRRKTLRNALKELLSAESIASEGIDPGARAETLSISDFANLANSYQRQLNQ